MKVLSETESDLAYQTVTNLGNVSECTRNEIINVLKYSLNNNYKILFDWLDEVDYVLENNTEKKYNFVGKKMIFYFSEYTTVDYLNRQIRYYIIDLKEEFNTTKNIENIVPFAYEFLFENKPIHSNMNILEHFQHGNFVFVKINYDTHKKLKNRNKYESHKREIIIEKWFKDGIVQYKTKAKGFMEQFKDQKKAITAPKVQEILIKNKIITKRIDIETAIDIITEKSAESTQVYLSLETQIKVDSLCLIEILKPIVVYNDGKFVKISFILDDFRGSIKNRQILGSRYFKINQYGGLEQTELIPVSTRLNLPDDNELYNLPYDKTPRLTKDIFIPISEDETKILDDLDYTYIKANLIHASHEAAEYEVNWNEDINIISVPRFFFSFAKYGDAWVSTDERNKKVIELREASKFADDLISIGG